MNPYISSAFAKDNTPFKEVLELLNKNKLYSVEIGSNHAYEESYKYIRDYNNFSFLVHNYFPIPQNEFVINIASQNIEIREKKGIMGGWIMREREKEREEKKKNVKK